VWRVVIASLVVWAMATVVYVAHLVLNYLLGHFACETPVGSSNYGHEAWQWWPPGTACQYSTARIPTYGLVAAHADHPSVTSAVIAIVLVAWPITTLILACSTRSRQHRRQHEAETATSSY
jgi:hypothetical protein